MYRKNKKRSFVVSKYLTVITVVIGIVIIALGGFAWHRWHDSSADSSTKTPGTSTAGKQSIDLSPATPAERQDSDGHKEAIVQQENQQTSTTPTASPTITYAGQSGNEVEVDAEVEGVVESGGTCTLTATLGTSTLTRTTTAVRNAQSSSCPAFIINRADFAKAGSWTIQVAYSSANYNGTSAKQSLKIE